MEVERTLKGVLQSDFGVHEFFHSNQLSLNHTISDDVSAPRVNKLVRYQGVIQDIFNPEYYTAGISLNYAKEEANYSDRFILGKYKEHLQSLPFDQDLDSDSVVTMERTVALLHVSEGTSIWLEPRKDTGKSTNSKKRSSEFSPGNDNKKKIQLISPGDGGHEESLPSSSCSRLPSGDRLSELASEQTIAVPQHSCCLVKFYDIHDDESFRINDMVEIIGIYSQPAMISDPDNMTNNSHFVSNSEMLEDEVFESVGLSRHPAPENCPRIHCLVFRKLGSTFPLLFQPQMHGSDVSYSMVASYTTDPAISPTYSGVATEMLTDTSKRLLLQTREKIITLLTEVCQGDALCANYLLLAILSGAISSSTDGYIVLRMVTGAEITTEKRKKMVDSLGYVLSNLLPRCVQMHSDCLPPPPTKHLDSVSVCSCCSVLSSTTCTQYVPNAKSWHLGQGTLVLVTESADRKAPQSYSMEFFRELVFERTMRVRIQDGIFYSSDTHIPVNLSFVLLSDASCVSSECSLLGPDDDISPAVVTISLAADGALHDSGESERDRDYIVLSDDDEDGESYEDGQFAAPMIPHSPPTVSSSSSSSSSLPKPPVAIEESDWVAMRVWWSLCVSNAKQHMDALTMDERLQAAAEQDFVSTRQLHKQDPSLHPNLSEVGFHRWLRLVRLIAASSFETESISLQHWVKMRSMEYRRLQRTVGSQGKPQIPQVHIID
eukprot:gene25343-33877_t